MAIPLTHRDNFQRMMRGDQPQRLPLDIWYWVEPAQIILEKHTGTRDAVQALDLAVRTLSADYPDDSSQWRAAYQRIGFTLPATATVGSGGFASEAPPLESLGEAYHLRHMLHPLSMVQDMDTLRSLPWLDVSQPQWYTSLRQRVQAIHAEGRVAYAWLNCTIFEFSWYLRGMTELCADLIEGNQIGQFICEYFTQRAIRLGREYVQAGVDVIGLGDDVGTQRGMLMSLEFWAEHLQPRMQRIMTAIKQAVPPAGEPQPWIFYHSDGDVRQLMPELVKLGVDILNPVQPECMPMPEIVPLGNNQLAYWGMIGTQTTMPFGTPEQVRQAVRELAEFARTGTRLVVAPTHVIEPDVPWENVQALVDEVKRTKL